jgi:hypothetical protein
MRLALARSLCCIISPLCDEKSRVRSEAVGGKMDNDASDFYRTSADATCAASQPPSVIRKSNL